eukprot:scaffold118157_cov49-Attheya_sp.AAC.3
MGAEIVLKKFVKQWAAQFSHRPVSSLRAPGELFPSGSPLATRRAQYQFVHSLAFGPLGGGFETSCFRNANFARTEEHYRYVRYCTYTK